jgi:hypothetical protein
MSGGKKRRNKPRKGSQPPVPAAKQTPPTKEERPTLSFANTAKWLLVFLTVIETISAVMPIFFESVSPQTPTSLFPSNPYSLPVEIANESPFPLWDVNTSCEVGDALTRDGSIISGVVTPGLSERDKPAILSLWFPAFLHAIRSTASACSPCSCFPGLPGSTRTAG